MIAHFRLEYVSTRFLKTKHTSICEQHSWFRIKVYGLASDAFETMYDVARQVAGFLGLQVMAEGLLIQVYRACHWYQPVSLSAWFPNAESLCVAVDQLCVERLDRIHRRQTV